MAEAKKVFYPRPWAVIKKWFESRKEDRFVSDLKFAINACSQAEEDLGRARDRVEELGQRVSVVRRRLEDHADEEGWERV